MSDDIDLDVEPQPSAAVRGAIDALRNVCAQERLPMVLSIEFVPGRVCSLLVASAGTRVTAATETILSCAILLGAASQEEIVDSLGTLHKIEA